MTVENTQRTVSTTGLAGPTDSQVQSAAPVTVARETVHTDTHTSTTGPARPELGRRITVLVFGLIQLVIGARFVLLLLDAREANGLVSGILNVSQLFVGPFEGILRSDALHAGGSIFEIAALVAIAGWTILEVVIIKAIAVFQRQPA